MCFLQLNNTLEKVQSKRKSSQQQLQEQQQQQANNLKQKSSSDFGIASNTDIETNNFRPMKLLQRTPTQDSSTSSTSSSSNAKSPLDDLAASFQPVMMVLHKPTDEYQGATYTNPLSTQTVKILRRPTQSSEPRNNGIRPKQPIKTLQQREQEYAEARLRIMGSAKNPEDELT